MQEIKINDNNETVTCRLCGQQVKRVYGKHLQFFHGGIKSEEYKEMFSGAPLMAKADLTNTIKNAGQHMKDEKYKKMFSEMFSGEKNPRHSSKVSKQELKEGSPFSIEFYKKRYPNLTADERQNMLSENAKYFIKDRVSTNQKQYWLNLGFNDEEAIKKVTERQQTFTYEKCVEKYGSEKGGDKWKERQTKWLKSLVDSGKVFSGQSSIARGLFEILIEKCSLNTQNINTIDYNKEYRIDDVKNFYMYDFTLVDKKKIIEYNGDIFHANPAKFKAGERPNPLNQKLTSEDIWLKDERKNKAAIDKGFEVLTIWDSDYRKNPETEIQKCVDFINS